MLMFLWDINIVCEKLSNTVITFQNGSCVSSLNGVNRNV